MRASGANAIDDDMIGTRTGAIGLVTPEAVLLELDVADFGSRLAARLIDGAVQGGTFLVLVLLFQLTGFFVGSFSTAVAIVVFVVASFGILFVYPAVGETIGRGRTIGKRAIGLRVITIEGRPIRFRHAAARAAVAVIDVFPGGVLACLSMLVDKRCRRLGDLVAGTVVVRERGVADATSAVWFPSPPGWERYVAELPVAALSSEQYELVRTFLLRAPSLTVAARSELAGRLAHQISMVLGRPLGPGTPPELWLSAVAASWQRTMAR
ncbi:MAG: RDD family protein [Acidimicrobiia bacterium]